MLTLRLMQAYKWDSQKIGNLTTGIRIWEKDLEKFPVVISVLGLRRSAERDRAGGSFTDDLRATIGSVGGPACGVDLEGVRLRHGNPSSRAQGSRLP